MDENRRKKRPDWGGILMTARVLAAALLLLGIGFRLTENSFKARLQNPRPPAAQEDAGAQGTAEVQPRKALRNAFRPSYMIYYGPVDDAVIREAKQYDIVILHPRFGGLTREKVQAIQKDGTLVMCYLSIGEDLRTDQMTPEEMLRDKRFTGDGTGPRVDPRAPGEKGLDGVDPLGKASPRGRGFASYYLDDNDQDGLPDFNPSFHCAYTNMGDPAWFDELDGMTIDGEDGVSGIREILTDGHGRGLGCDGLFLDTIDTCAPNVYTGDDSPNRTRFEWTAPGVSDFMARLREKYPGKYILQNRGLFFYNYEYPHFDYSPRQYVDFFMFESYRLDSNPERLFNETYFEENKYVYCPKISAEANRPDGFGILSLGYAEGPEEYQLKDALLGAPAGGTDTLLEDVRQAEEAGFSHYITDRYMTLVNRFALDHREEEDDRPPVWTSVHNFSKDPFTAPEPRVGIGAADPVSGGVTVHWDAAVDKSGVDYTLYYQKTPFDFESDPDLTGAQRLTLVPEIGTGYGYQALPESYPYQARVEGLDPGKKYYFVIRAKDRSPAGNEEKNTVTAAASVPLR